MGCRVFAFRGSTSIRHEQRDSTDRARRVLRQPQADTARVEGVAAGRQHAELVSLFVFRQTDDAPASLPTERWFS
jgi:predicted phage gp36 major capsid-like protein